jgi:general secretion pathway protein K
LRKHHLPLRVLVAASVERNNMISRPQAHGEDSNDGFVVVAVLWLLGALATLALVYSLYVNQATAAFLDHDERLQATALVYSGIELAAYRLSEKPNQHPSVGRFTFRQGNAVIGVAYSAENGRIDLNFAPREIIAGLFTGLGADSQEALYFADRIVAWRTPLAAGGPDSEAAIYQSAGKSYRPRHGPFQSVDEIGLVIGMPLSFVTRALPYLTVYSGQQGINVLSAPPAVLAALPGMTPDQLQTLIVERENAAALDDPAYQTQIQSQLGNMAGYTSLQPGPADRVNVDIRFQSKRRMVSQVVILLADKDTQPYRVLSWRDEELSSDARDNDSRLR